MTKYLESLEVGDYVKMQGPIGRCTYKHDGYFSAIFSYFCIKNLLEIKIKRPIWVNI